MRLSNKTDFMRKHYSEEACAKWREQHDHWPSEEWIDLLWDIQAALAVDPESGRKLSRCAGSNCGKPMQTTIQVY